MFDKLAAVEARYVELESLLVEPDVIANRKEFTKLSKERSSIEQIVHSYRAWKELQEQIALLPAWPVYGSVLDPRQYDNLSLEVVRVMTSAILDTKSALEKRIAEMVRSSLCHSVLCVRASVFSA